MNLTNFYYESIYSQHDWTKMVNFSCQIENFIDADGTAADVY